LGNGHYPETIEDALQVLSLHSDQKRSIKHDRNDSNDEAKVTLAQADGKKKTTCWNCGKKGHVKKDCPELQQQTGNASNVQVPHWAGGAGHQNTLRGSSMRTMRPRSMTRSLVEVVVLIDACAKECVGRTCGQTCWTCGQTC